jgi:hypothetical protein
MNTWVWVYSTNGIVYYHITTLICSAYLEKSQWEEVLVCGLVSLRFISPFFSLAENVLERPVPMRWRHTILVDSGSDKMKRNNIMWITCVVLALRNSMQWTQRYGPFDLRNVFFSVVLCSIYCCHCFKLYFIFMLNANLCVWKTTMNRFS